MGRVTHADTQRMMAYLLSRGSALPYRKDGLIMHLDAIQNTRGGHNASATTWEDLSGVGMDVALYNATWGADYCSFTGADDSYGLGPKWTFATHGTIEVVYSCEGAKTLYGIAGWGLYGSAQTRRGFLRQTKIIAIWDAQASYTFAPNHPTNGVRVYAGFSLSAARQGATSLSVSQTDAGGSTIDSFRIAAWGQPGDTNYPNWGLPGRIMAVRVYDANLSAAELEAHWLIDKARFNIPD